MDSVGVRVVTRLKRNMKQRLMSLGDRLLLRKRAVVETVIDQLKNISQIEHSRHRSPVNCFVNILCGSIALPSTLQARNRDGTQLGLFCLTRTHVK